MIVAARVDGLEVADIAERQSELWVDAASGFHRRARHLYGAIDAFGCHSGTPWARFNLRPAPSPFVVSDCGGDFVGDFETVAAVGVPPAESVQ